MWATPETLAIMDVRYGQQDAQPLTYGETIRLGEVDVSFVVRAPDDVGAAWHELSVELDGRKQWARRIGTSNPGEQDGLDYHVRVSVAAGAALRVRAMTKVRGAVRQRLLIEAVES